MININQILINSLDGCIILKENMYPTKFYTMSLEGWSPFTLDVNNPHLSDIVELSAKFIENISFLYGKTHVFSSPFFVFVPDSDRIQVKIGTMEKVRYNEIMKKLKKKAT